jgi:hypothetical protein
MHKEKNKSQVLIEAILLVLLIAGYLINKLYEANYFVSDTYFYSGMVLAAIMYFCILWLHRYRYKSTDDERKKKSIINSILIIHAIIFLYGLVIVWVIFF